MLSAKKKIYLLVLTACLIDVLLFVLVLLPLVRKIQSNANNLNIQKNDLAALAAQSNSLDNFQKSADNLKNYSQLVQSAFVDPSAPVQFLEFLEGQAENYHLQLTTSPFDVPAVKGDLWSAIGVRVSIKGQLADCLRFVEMLENSQWVIAITNFDLQKAIQKETTGDSGAVLPGEAFLSLDIKAFFGQSSVLKNYEQ